MKITSKIRAQNLAWFFAGICTVGVIALMFQEPFRAGITSAELRISEPSSLGLDIIPASCPSYPHYAGECSGEGACESHAFCQGNEVWYSCPDIFSHNCPYGCSNGACIPGGAAPTVDIRVSPSLVRTGGQTQVVWSATDVASCTVEGSNGDSWSGATLMGCSGATCAASHTSGTISERTSYTLSCIGTDDSVAQDTAVVNVLPVFQEL